MEKILEIIAQMVESSEDGNTSATEVLFFIKSTTDELKKAKEQIEDAAFDEFYQYKEGKDATIDGYKVTHKNGGYTWDFKGVKKHADIEAKKKELEAKYKALFEHSKCIDVDTGEELDIKRKPKKDSLTIKKI